MSLVLKRLAILPVVLGVTLGAGVLSGCDEGPAERAGKAVDETARDAKRAVQDATN